jgi:hypothetical protein
LLEWEAEKKHEYIAQIIGNGRPKLWRVTKEDHGQDDAAKEEQSWSREGISMAKRRRLQRAVIIPWDMFEAEYKCGSGKMQGLLCGS